MPVCSAHPRGISVHNAMAMYSLASYYEQTGLDFLGIDLLFGREKPYFCEINVMPGLEGIEKASGINVAGKIIETIQSDFTSKT